MTTADRVKKVVADKMGVTVEELSSGTSIQDHLGADSLDIIDIAMGLESEFSRTIPDEDFGRLTTVGAIVEYLEERQPFVA